MLNRRGIRDIQAIQSRLIGEKLAVNMRPESPDSPASFKLILFIVREIG
jgi:hypothetical protein